MIAMTTVSSSKAPPMAVRPLPISSHLNTLNFLSASPSISHALARRTIDTPVDIGIFTLLIILAASDNSRRAPPTPIKPLMISGKDKSESSTIAPAKTSIAIATRMSANADLTIPLDSKDVRVLVIDSKLMVNILSIAAIASNDLPISTALSSDMVLSAFARIPTAAAIPTRDQTLIP